MVKLNDRFEKMEVSQKYYLHGEKDVSKAIEIVLSPSEDSIADFAYYDAIRTIINESERRSNNVRIDRRKKEILNDTKIGDLITPGSKWGASRSTVCAFYDLVNEGYLKLVKVRSKVKDTTVYKGYGHSGRTEAYSYRVVYERIR
jgi:hypothetical protein